MLSEDSASFLDLGFGTGSAGIESDPAGTSSFVVEGSDDASLAIIVLTFFVI